MIFVFPRRSQMLPGHTELLPGHTELFPGHTDLLPGTQHGVLEAGLRGLERHLGGFCLLLDGLEQLPNALGTFWVAPERESLIFQWF